MYLKRQTVDRFKRLLELYVVHRITVTEVKGSDSLS
jgi:hypothetical protein